MPEPITILSTIEAASKTLELAKKLEPLLDNFSAVSKKQATEVATALNEVHKQVQAVFDITKQYRSLAVQDDFAKTAPPILLSLEGPKARVQVQHAGGSCQVITNIYHHQLKSWFKNNIGILFNQAEYKTAEQIFETLSDADHGLFNQMAGVCEFIGKEARDVFDLIANGQSSVAFERVSEGQKALAKVDSSLAETMLVLLKVRNEALERAGVTTLHPGPSE